MGMVSFGLSFGQTTILDFETAATSTTLEYFGNGSVGGNVAVIETPDKSGENTGDRVAGIYRGVGAES